MLARVVLRFRRRKLRRTPLRASARAPKERVLFVPLEECTNVLRARRCSAGIDVHERSVSGVRSVFSEPAGEMRRVVALIAVGDVIEDLRVAQIYAPSRFKSSMTPSSSASMKIWAASPHTCLE